MLLYIHASLLPDNFDRVQLEFVGFKKVVFVRFCPQQIFGRRNIQPFALIGSCPALFIEPGITISITKNQAVHLKFRISGGIIFCLKNPCRTSKQFEESCLYNLLNVFQICHGCMCIVLLVSRCSKYWANENFFEATSLGFLTDVGSATYIQWHALSSGWKIVDNDNSQLSAFFPEHLCPAR